MRFLPRPTSLTGPAIILIAAVIAVGPLFLRGPSCSADFTFHFVSWIDARHSISTGLLYPHWASSPNFGAGEPKFVFYPPISWMSGAILGMLMPWTVVTPVLFVLLLAATGMATRALARVTLADGPATLAGCTTIFIGYALFCIYARNDFADLTGGFWIPLLLLFALRRRNPSSSFWERSFDGSAAPLALVVAGIWLSNGPVGIMASYLLAVIALVSALVEKSLVPVVRAVASTLGGMGLASLYLIPAVYESKWASIQSALIPDEYKVENNWLFGLGGDPHTTSQDPLLHQVSKIAVIMLMIAFSGGVIAWIRGVVPRERRWWLPMVLIPPAILFLLLPVSQLAWNTLPEWRLLQFPWRWLVVLQAPMGICFASAVWSDRRNVRIPVIAACAALFVGISVEVPYWWFKPCGSLTASLQESIRDGIGFIGKPEYTPPGTRFPLVDFLLDSKGNLQADPQGNPILHPIPDACLLNNSPETSVQGETGLVPAWRGESAYCNSTGWQQLNLLSGSSGSAAPNYLPEQKWFRGVAEHAGYAILRLRYYPAWAVEVNGVPVTGVAEQERGLIAVPVPKGNVLISVDWTTTGDVVVGRWVSGVALLLVTCLFIFERKRLQTHLSLDRSNPLESAEQLKLFRIEPKDSISSTRIDHRNTPSHKSDKQIKNAKRKKERKPGRGGS
ncbi:MAG TPA: hypothetical protein VHD85_13180 [Terracidiphilus sp.]|nr:hypothetical protein [Terracidiphilus sp.]